MSQVTQLLRDWSAGRPEARDELVGLVYEPLRAIAERHLHRERDGHTLQPTALVNELYLRFIDQHQVNWHDRTHFFAVAAQVMRRILVDHARSRGAQKRGGDAEELPLDESVASAAAAPAPEDDVDLGALDEALARLARVDPQAVRVVELRYFAGLTLEETAAVLDVSTATVKRDWAMARAWLYRELTGEGDLSKETPAR